MTTRVKPLDLPIATVIEIEKAVGARMSDWPEGVSSDADLYSRIYAAGTGEDLAKVQEDMSMADLIEAVSMNEEEDEDPT